jgi:hypothetical protein
MNRENNINPRATDEPDVPRYSDRDDVPASDVTNVDAPGVTDDKPGHPPTPDSVGSGGPIESGR